VRKGLRKLRSATLSRDVEELLALALDTNHNPLDELYNQAEIVVGDVLLTPAIIRAHCGAEVTVSFHNEDTEPHRLTVHGSYDDASPIFRGKSITRGRIRYRFRAPAIPGTYRFRCSDRPNAATGRLIVSRPNR
jgi:plastocyanin